MLRLGMSADGDFRFGTAGDKVYFKNFQYTQYEDKTTDYVGEFIYEDDQLQLIQHEEGRIVRDATTSSAEYQYHLKDHLGNTRTSFTTKPKEIVFTNTYEGNSDESLFEEMGNIVEADLHDYQHADENTNHTKTPDTRSALPSVS